MLSVSTVDSVRRSRAATPRAAAPSALAVHPGRPIDRATRGYMERRFGHDFSRVRIHDDAGARASAQGLGAAAYTVGRDIAFARAVPSAATTAGRSLLAHELTHVVQQEHGWVTPPLDASAAHESEAEAVSRGTGAVHVRESTGVGPARAPSVADPRTPLVAEAVAVMNLRTPTEVREIEEIVDAYLCTASYSAFRSELGAHKLRWPTPISPVTARGRMSPDLQRMLFGPSPEEPDYWSSQDPLLEGREIVIGTETRERVDFTTVVIPGVGDQGDKSRTVPVYSWVMTPKALRAYLVYASGGPLTSFEETLADHWAQGQVQVQPLPTDQGVLYGYYVRREISAASFIPGDTWYDATGTVFRYMGRRDLPLVREDPIMEVLVARAIPIERVAAVAAAPLRLAGRILRPAWRLAGAKLRPYILAGKLMIGRAGAGMSRASVALEGGESAITLVEESTAKAATTATHSTRTVATNTARTEAATARTARAVQAAVAPGAQQVTIRQSQVLAGAALIAEYERLTARKLPSVVRRLLAAERQTGSRTRLAQLRTQFEALMREVGDAVELTAQQRARASVILREAREIARADFGNLQRKVWGQLRADAELERIAGRMIEAGAAEDRATGALRLWTRKADGTITHESMNIEHSTRLSDNPWAAKDAENLIVTDAGQNQQFNEALRALGGVWPTDPIEDFIVRHLLNRQGVDFRP